MSSVLFVCLGNICRSPTAEAVFRSRATAAGLSHIEIDSAGTGDWHIGSPPDQRAIDAGAARGYQLEHLRARQLCADDYERFKYIIVMDQKNLKNVLAGAPEGYEGSVRLFLDFTGKVDAEVPDPYLGGSEAFGQVLDMVEAASDGLINVLETLDQAARS